MKERTITKSIRVIRVIRDYHAWDPAVGIVDFFPEMVHVDLITFPHLGLLGLLGLCLKL